MSQSNPLQTILDLFFPKFNANFSDFQNYLTLEEIQSQSAFFKKIELQNPFLPQIAVLSNYSNPLIQDLIVRAKVSGELAILNDFVKLFEIKTQELNLPKPDYICFVPADPKRQQQRGYHLPQILAKKIAQKTNSQILDLILKTETTKSQTEMKKQERENSLRDVFKLKNNQVNLENKTVYLIDDVVTTGNTLNQVTKILLQRWPNLNLKLIALSGQN